MNIYIYIYILVLLIMNNDFYIHYIDGIKDKLQTLNSSLFNVPNQTKIYTVSTEPSKHRDDSMQLNNLLWSQQLLTYRDTQKKINNNINYKPQIFTVIDDETTLIENIKKNGYKTTWSRLKRHQKTEKLQEYIISLYQDNTITTKQYENMILHMPDIIKKGTSKKIIYDSISKIISIWCIQYDKVANTYTFTL